MKGGAPMLLLQTLSRSASAAAVCLLGLPAYALAQTMPQTTTVLAISAINVSQGIPVTLTATVSGLALGQGQVAFCDITHVSVCTPASANLLGIAQITSTSQATLKLRLGIGPHQLVARFLGTTAAIGSSSGPISLTVSSPTGAVATTTSLTASPANGNPGPNSGEYSLSSVVTTPTGIAPPNGTVAFRAAAPSGVITIGSATLGSGTQAGPSLTPALTTPTATGNGVIADFNGDGIPDLALAGAPGASVSVLPGNGDGSFPAPSSTTVVPGLCASACIQIATADFNSDGHADLVALESSGTGAQTTYSLQFAYGKGDGTFTVGAPIALSLAPSTAAPQLVVSDYNGDGQPDLLVNGSASSGVDLAVVLQQPDHSFRVTYPTSFGSGGILPPAYIVATDLNSDGKTDFLGVGPVGTSTAQSLLLFLSNGDGTFSASSVSLSNIAPTFLPPVVGDFNGDGLPDVVVFEQGAYQVQLGEFLPGNGQGSFAAGTTLAEDFYEGAQMLSFGAIDINGDGLADILITGIGPQTGPGAPPLMDRVLLSQGQGDFSETSFPLPINFSTPYPSAPLLSADLNGDGLPDAVLGRSDGSCCFVLLNQTGDGQANASVPSVQLPNGGALSLTAVFTPSGNFAASSSPAASVIGTPLSSTLALTASPQTATLGQPVTLTATLSPFSTPNGFTTNGETVAFATGSSSPTATLKDGVASVIISSLPLGTNQVSASYNGDGTFNPALSGNIPVIVNAVQASSAALSGSYAFHYSGTQSASYGPVQGGAAVGVFTADGAGNITGEEDINSASLTAAETALTGTYTLNAEGIGTLHLVNGVGLVQDFGIVLASRDTNGVAHAAALLGLGSLGSVTSGEAALQTSGELVLTAGSYTLRLRGETACQGTACAALGHPAGSVSLLGSLLLSVDGTGSAGLDHLSASGPGAQNLGGTVTGDANLNAALSGPDSLGRYTLEFTGSALPPDEPSHFTGYVVSPTGLYLLSTDPHSGFILLSGSLVQQ